MKDYGDVNIVAPGEIINADIEHGTSDPSPSLVGRLFYRTDLGALRVYNGSAWTSLTAAGVYNATFGSGYVQYIGPNGSLTGNTSFIFGTALPNPQGGTAPGILVGSGVPTGLIITDAVTSGTPGINLVMAAGEAAPSSTDVGGNLYLYGGGSASGTAGTATLQGGTGVAGGGGAVVISGGNSSTGAAGSVTLEGGAAGSGNNNGGSINIAASTATGSGTPGYINLKSGSTTLYSITNTGAIYIGGTTPGTSGQVLTAGGGNVSPSWAAAVNSIVAGTGISISGATGTVTINAALTATYIGYGNGSGFLTGTSDFTWTDSTHTLNFGTASAGPSITVTAGTTNGTTFNITGSAGAGTGNGGTVNLNAGAGSSATTGGSGGGLNLNGGNANGTGNNTGGAVSISGGTATGSGTSGAVYVIGGLTYGTGPGGNVSIEGGTGSSAGGNVSIEGGAGNNGGTVTILGGYSSASNNVGGQVTIEGGSAYTYGGTAAGGTVLIIGGMPATTGTAGAVTLQGGNQLVAYLTTGQASTGGAANVVGGTGTSISANVSGGNTFIYGGDATIQDTGTSYTGTPGYISFQTAPAFASINGTISGTYVERLRIDSTGQWLVGGSAGTSGQVLKSNGASAAPTWTTTPTLTGTNITAVASITAANSTTNTAYDVPFLSAATGTVTILSNAGLTFNPSTINFYLSGTTPQIKAIVSAARTGNFASVVSQSDTSNHDIIMAHTSSTYSGALITGGPSGEQGVLYTNWAGPLTLGTNSIARLGIASAGTVTIALPSSGTAAALILPASSATIPAMSIASGTLLTTAAAGVTEYDGTDLYFTNETTSGRGLIPVEQVFHLTANGTAITTIANFFGTTSNISLVASGYYDIEVVCYYSITTTGDAVTFTFTNSSAPTSMCMDVIMSPAAGITSVATPTNAYLMATLVDGSTAAQTAVTPVLTASTTQFAKFNIRLKNGTGTSLKIQATSANAITPLLGSYWKCKRIPSANVGTFAA